MKTLSVEQIQTILKEKIPDDLIVAEHTDNSHFYRHTRVNELYASVTTKCNILESPHLKKWAAKLAVEHFVNEVTLDRNILIEPGRIEILQKASILKHQDTFEDAGDVGTRGHAVVEQYLNQWMETKVRPDDIRKFINDEDMRVFAIARSAEMFCRDWNVIPIASEMRVASTKYKFAGTLDSLMMVLSITEKGKGDCINHDFLPLSQSNPLKVKCLHCELKGQYEFAIVDWKTSNSIDKVEYAMQTSAYWQALYEMTGLKPKKIFIVRLDKAHAKYEVRCLSNRTKAFKAFVLATKIYDWLHDNEPKLVSANSRERISLESLVVNTESSNG